MSRAHVRRGALAALATAAFLVSGTAAGAADERGEIELLKAQIEELRRADAARQRQLEEMRRLLERLQPAAAEQARPVAPAAALDQAVETVERPAPVAAPAAAQPAEKPKEAAATSALERAVQAVTASQARTGDLYARQIGASKIRLIDLGMDVMTAAGTSTADDAEIRRLQAGAHDPRRRGFTLQQAEFSLMGAVDPYFTGEAYILYTTGGVELEEAFFTTSALPYGLQVEGGYFLTEFGRINPRHPHQWEWVDAPVINTRLFGGDQLRAPGVRLGWLTPLPWYSELDVGAQNANEGETTTSFLAEEGIGGRPAVRNDVRSLKDLLYLTRWANSWDVGEDVTSLLGVSGLFGPNSTGSNARTYIYGADLTMRWRPTGNFRGWPFLLWQTEVMKRDYTADNFLAGNALDGGGDGDDGHGHTHGLRVASHQAQHTHGDEDGEEEFDEDIPGDLLRDWGLYSQVLWGFHYRWAGGLRFEYASGSGSSLPDGRSKDPARDDRFRFSPLLVFHPTEFSRLRLQYNLDHAQHLDGNQHSVWLSAEISYGAHPAHTY